MTGGAVGPQSSGGPQSPHGQWRLLAPALVGWAAAAALIHVPGTGRLLALVAGVSGVLAATAWRVRARRRDGEQRWAGAALVACAVLLAIGARIDGLERAATATALTSAAENGRSVQLLARLAGYPAPSASFAGEERGWVRASLVAVGGETLRQPVPGILWLPSAPEQQWHPGATITATGTLVRAPPANLAAYEVRVTAQEYAGPAGGFGRWSGPAAADMRAALRDAAESIPGAALVPGLAVGDTRLVSEELERVMRDSSLTHLTAVSGSNCALVIAAVTAVASRAGAGRRVRILLAAVALGGFVVVVGPDASVQRAAMMAGVLLVSSFGGKRRQALSSLGLATIGLLIANPWQAIQPGFALSVTATAGILLWATPLDAWLRARARLPRLLTLPLAVTAVAQFACSPLLLLLQPGLPVGGVLANLLAASAAPLGTGLGLLAMLLLPLACRAGEAVLWLASWPARWIEAAGEVGVALPASRWFWPGGWGGALLLAGVYVLCAAAWAVASGWAGRYAKAATFLSGRRMPWRRDRKRTGLEALLVLGSSGLAAGIVLGVAIVVPTAVRLGVPRDWAIVACDVGQGDAILLRDPQRPRDVMLVDTGDDPDLLRACLDLFGVREVSLLVLTHNHRDHVGALAVALERSGAVLIAPPSDEDAGREPLSAQLAGARAAAVEGRAGLGGGGGGARGGLRWEVLAPSAGRQHATANATSLVLRVDVGESTVLLLGDTGAAEQRELMLRHPDLRVDVVKVAHHGSRDQAAGLYAGLGADLALISVGKANRYGHPSRGVLEELRSAGTVILRTDELGSVAVRLGGAGNPVWGTGPGDTGTGLRSMGSGLGGSGPSDSRLGSSGHGAPFVQPGAVVPGRREH